MTERMFYIKRREFVKVYSIQDKVALIFDPAVAAKNNGHGWITVSINSLIPEEYADIRSRSGFISKSEEEKQAKKRICLLNEEENVWKCSNGTSFSGYAAKECALNHEILIIRAERGII